MSGILKKIDSWGQLLLVVITSVTALFIPFLVLTAYIIIGGWQLISSAIYIVAGSAEEKALRKNYWIGIVIYLIVCIACFNIKPLVIATIYLLWYVPAIFALLYCYITVKEAKIWPIQRLKPRNTVR